MTLGALCGRWADAGVADALEVTGLTADSRRVEPGDVFVALPYVDRPGFRFDGHAFIADAVAQGAAAVIATDASQARAAASDVPVVVVDDTRWLLPRLAARWYGEPSRELRLVGITGTNGKTTTAYLLDHILSAAGHRTVLAGTIETRLGDEVRPATTTTPDPVTLQALWREAVERGVTAGAMEVSSHALDQHRTDHTWFEVAVFTNLTQDHLDYHETMEAYAGAKARLVSADETGYAPRAVINLDDPWGRRLMAGQLRDPLGYGVETTDAEVTAGEVSFDAKGSRFEVNSPWGRWRQELAIVGPYNVGNALAALTAALALGIDPEVARGALATARGAPGRLEPVDEGQPFAVLIDYAHTPDALANVLGAARALATGRLVCVFGCGGDRDRTKRPQMGAIAVELSDLTVVTSDNPRTEDPLAIIGDILAGIADPTGEDVIVEPDRAAAIGRALTAAREGDVVVIAGKGHEDYQILGERKVHFDDREVARDWLRGHD